MNKHIHTNVTELHLMINTTLRSLAVEAGLQHTMTLTKSGLNRAVAFALTMRPEKYEFKDMCLEFSDWLYKDADILKGGLALVKVTVWAPTQHSNARVSLCVGNGIGKQWMDGCFMQSFEIEKASDSTASETCKNCQGSGCWECDW